MLAARDEPIINVNGVSFAYTGENTIRIIDDATFTANDEEIVAIIGPSGCGKSTLLRIMAGLVKSLTGAVVFNGKKVAGPVPQFSFVFQDFALLPWLTNKENVKLGLSRMRIGNAEKDRKATELLDQFGLSGFEDAYPNMLSGGMKQRVGIARAIASNPVVLLMDEPFSALDELTANTLREDVLYLLREGKFPIRSVVMVTHNVEEAAWMADKIVMLSDKPSHVKWIKKIEMKHPRDKHSKEFLALVDEIYTKLTER